MSLTYNRRLDRCIDLRGGLAGNGMHELILDEIELGCRAAHNLDDPEQAFWVLDLYSIDRSA